MCPARLAAALNECRTPEDLRNLRALCEVQPSPLARLIRLATDHLDWPLSDNAGYVESSARYEVVKLERGLVFLEIIVGIAPLLGLVGTIFGMIGVFGDIGQTGINNMNDASKLAQGISLILLTHAHRPAHLHPSLVAWSYFSKKVEVIAVEMETLCDEFIRRQYRDKSP